MTVARIAISLDQNLAKALRKAAGKETTSAWIADAIARKLRSQGLLRVVGEWEAEHGPLSPSELDSALPPRRAPAKRKKKSKSK